MGETNGLDGQAWHEDSVVSVEWQVQESEHLISGKELGNQLARHHDDNHEQNIVKPEDNGRALFPLPVANVEIWVFTTTDSVDHESVEKEQKLTTDEESFDIWTSMSEVAHCPGSWMAFLVLIDVDVGESDDGDLATFEECDPGHHEEEDHEVENWVDWVPWRIVPLLADTVDDDGDGEDQKHRRPPVGELSPEAGERVVLHPSCATILGSDWSFGL